MHPLAERDLPEAQRIILQAFGTFLGVPDLETFWFPPYAHTRFGAEHIAAFTAEQDGRLVGSNFATSWGSVGFFGPLTIRPELWDSGIGQRLVAAACETFEGWGIRHAGLFTFAQSAKHIGLYGNFGFHPRFLTAVMAAPARPSPTTPGWSRYSELRESQRSEAEAATRELTDALHDGLDLRGEIRTVFTRGLGEEVLDYMREIAHAAIEAGADIVVGHGPHYSLPIEVYRGKPIFYGLGSFSFHTGHGGRRHGDWIGMMARVEFGKSGISEARFRFVRHNAANETVLCALADEGAALDRIIERSTRLGARLTPDGDGVRIGL